MYVIVMIQQRGSLDTVVHIHHGHNVMIYLSLVANEMKMMIQLLHLLGYCCLHHYGVKFNDGFIV